MCGIIGIISNHPVRSQIIKGLIALEYRGYDSSGIILQFEGEQFLKKTLAGLDNLENSFQNIDANLGIGHTRWATHGKVSLNNTHPISKNGWAIVHNGIIENFVEIKSEIKKFDFLGETDTEILLAFFIQNYNENNDPLKTIEIILDKCLGSFAFAIISIHHPDTIFFARKNSSPLLLAKNNEAKAIISDEAGLLNKFDKIFDIPSNHYGFCSPNEIKILPKIDIVFRKSNQIKLTEKIYETWMESEIKEQPNLWEKIKNNPLNLNINQKNKPTKIVLLGCGSAYYAASIGAIWIKKISNISAQAFIASEWEPDINDSDNTWVICISQSGETADTYSALNLAKAQNMFSIGIINNEFSLIAKSVDIQINLLAGIENSVASTKAFTAQLCRLFQFAEFLNNHFSAKNISNFDDSKNNDLSLINKSLPNFNDPKNNDLSLINKSLPNFNDPKNNDLSLINKSLPNFNDPKIIECAKFLSNFKNIVYIGKNQMAYLAYEGALKMKELTYINATGYPAGELKHGSLAMIDSNTPIIVIAPRGPYYKKTINNAEEAAARGAPVIIISDICEIDGAKHIQVPEISYQLSPIYYATYLQLLAYHTAKILNRHIDRPRNLAKSITVE